MLNLLFTGQSDPDFGSVESDIAHIMNILLRTVIHMSSTMVKESTYIAHMVAVMMGILRSMSAYHYEVYVSQLSLIEIRCFITEVLSVFHELVKNSVFPSDWMDMIMHQNTVILDSLRQLTIVIREKFYSPFEHSVWESFFSCAIAFLTQPSLQLDQFNVHKKSTILQRYEDIRRKTAHDITCMWMQLGEHKAAFVPHLVGSILEMSLIPDEELRKDTIPIFFDMMQCEYYSSKLVHNSYGDTKRNNRQNKMSFENFEKEMMEKLDIFVENGRGDEEYRQLFDTIMMDLCRNHIMLRKDGEAFVNMVSGLLSRLLEYRTIIHDENKENRMACTVSLLEFYEKVHRKEMFIRYVDKLCALHSEFENYAEAAFSLKLHSNMLNWNDMELSKLTQSHRHSVCKTHRELKETLYQEIIELFDKGKMWECAIELCKELANQYENEIFDYNQLSATHERMAIFYRKILLEPRYECEYFRVVFYGKRFPNFLRNKTFIYRGKEFERLSDFSSRVLAQHPSAELMRSMDTPSEEIAQFDGQFILINSVQPIMDDLGRRDQMSTQILKYYQTNNVNRFQFSRPISLGGKGDHGVDSLGLQRTIMKTSYRLPGKLRSAEVIETTMFNMTPLELAIETMQQTNKDIRELVKEHSKDFQSPINPLSIKIAGVIDAAVMGGLVKYEEAFLTPEYSLSNPDDSELVNDLKELIAAQIPLLVVALKVHRAKMTPDLAALQDRWEQLFFERREILELKYGKKVRMRKIEYHLKSLTSNLFFVL